MSTIWNKNKKLRGERRREEERRLNRSLLKGAAIFLLIAGTYFGTLFTFVTWYDHGSVTKDQAVPMDAVYSYYKAYARNAYRSFRTDRYDIEVYFSDGTYKTTDSTSIGDPEFSKLKNLKKGTVLHLLVHPRGNEILECKTDTETIVDFEYRKSIADRFLIISYLLGVFFYLCAFFALVKIIKKEVV